MKNVMLLMFLCLYIKGANAQCVADAGMDQHRCSSNSIIQLGGAPTATQGTPPYEYEWSIDPIPFLLPTIPYLYASHILDDTTVSNPTLASSSVVGDSIALYLKVTDHSGCVSYDTISITTSCFGTHLGGAYTYYINKGESVFLDRGPNVMVCSGYGYSTYSWTPTHGLSHTNLPSSFWATPDSSIEYTVTVTDAKGCQRTGGGPTYIIYVNDIGLEPLDNPLKIRLYPNPASDIIIVENETKKHIQGIRISDLKGQEIKAVWTQDQIDLGHISSGIYIIEVQTSNKVAHYKIAKE